MTLDRACELYMKLQPFLAFPEQWKTIKKGYAIWMVELDPEYKRLSFENFLSNYGIKKIE